MPKAFSMIGTSWNFARKQPALLGVGFWLLFLPFCIMGFLPNNVIMAGFLRGDGMFVLLAMLKIIAYASFIFGILCTLLIGKRLVQAKAGRSRTSFKAVVSQARGQFMPFLLTYVLATILSGVFLIPLFIATKLLPAQVGLALYSFPFAAYGWPFVIVLLSPAIVFWTYIIFFQIFMVTDNVYYMESLKKSAALVRGKFWKTLGLLAGIWASIYIPIMIIAFIIVRISFMLIFAGVNSAFPSVIGLVILLLIGGISAAIATIGIILFLLSIIQLCGYLKPSSYSN